MADATPLRLRLLGECVLDWPGGSPVALSTRKSLALLAYLAGQPGRRASRDRLAGLLWEDASPSQARLNLRKTLSTLRQETRRDGDEGALLDADNDSVWLAPGRLTTDVEALETAVASKDPAEKARVAELYTGDFLSDLRIRGASGFDAWAAVERQRLREIALTALSDLMERALDPGFAPEVGLQVAMRVLALDPLQERAHRAVMRLHVRQGRPAAALKQFHALADLLRRELNTEPESATRDLAREISAARHRTRAQEPGHATEVDAAQLSPVEEIVSERPPEPSLARRGRRRLAITAGAVGAVLIILAGGAFLTNSAPGPGLLSFASAREKSIAVLPFANFSTQAETGLFADGLTEEVINSLAQHADLKVTGRTSAFYFKGKNVDLRDIGRTLGVTYVVEGSVRREGDRLRVTAQLIDVSNGFHLWSSTYDRPMTDAFTIQDEVARTVAEELKVRMDGSQPLRMRRPDGRVYQLYLVARSHMRNGGKAELVTARTLFERQLVIAPNDPRSLAGYAEATIALAHQFELPFDEARQSSEAAVARALRADPGSAEAYSARSKIESVLALWTNQPGYEERALQAAKRAVELAPRNPEILGQYGRQLIALDRTDEAVGVLERAVELDPLDRTVQAQLGAAYRAAGRFDQAVRQYRATIELFPDHEGSRLLLGRLLYEQGDVVEAEREFKKAYEITGGPKAANYLSFLYFNLQLHQDAAAQLNSLRSPPIVGVVGKTLKLHLARDYDGALTFAESEVARDPDSHMRAIIYTNAAILGDYAKARSQLEALAPELLTDRPQVGASALDVAMLAAHVLNQTGEQAQARKILARVLAVASRNPGRRTLPSEWLARVNAYAELGQDERALSELRLAIDAGFHDRVDFDNFIHLEDWPSLRRLRGDPRLQRLIADIEARNGALRRKLLAGRRSGRQR